MYINDQGKIAHFYVLVLVKFAEYFLLKCMDKFTKIVYYKYRKILNIPISAKG